MSIYTSNTSTVHPRIIKVLWKQQQELLKKSPDCVTPIINDEDPLDIQADIEGPQSTPYENGIFRVKFVIPSEFPQLAPKGFFMTKIFHPNISEKGEICVNTLKRDWNPQQWSLYNLFEVIKCLLIVPFPQSSLNEEAGKMFMENYDEYFRVAKMFTQIHAKKKIVQKEIIDESNNNMDDDVDMTDCRIQNTETKNEVIINQNQNISQNNSNIINNNNFTQTTNNNNLFVSNNSNNNLLCDNKNNNIFGNNNNDFLLNTANFNRSKTMKISSNFNCFNNNIKTDFFHCKTSQEKPNFNNFFNNNGNNNLCSNNNNFNTFNNNDFGIDIKKSNTLKDKPKLGSLPSMLSNHLKKNRGGNNFGFFRSRTQNITFDENNMKKSNQDEINKWLMRI